MENKIRNKIVSQTKKKIQEEIKIKQEQQLKR